MKTPTLTETKQWHVDIDDYRIKIMLADEHYRALATVSGWTYYIVLRERVLKDKFEQLWLERDTESTLSFPVYRYEETPIAKLDWHGGVTFYQKLGTEPGFRGVEFGCDYNHYWDQGRDYSLEQVYSEALATLDQIKDWVSGKYSNEE